MKSAPTIAEVASRPRPALSLIDAASITIGIIVGSAIFRIAPSVAGEAAGWAADQATSWFPTWINANSSHFDLLCLTVILAVWVVGGLVALLGAMCYAELATAYREVGGTYVYLSEALGRSTGFAFAWAEFWIVRPGNIGAVAYVLAVYAAQLLPLELRDAPFASVLIASSAIVALALLNAAGLHVSKQTQNVLTAIKLLGLLAIVVVGLMFQSPETHQPQSIPLTGSLSLALIQIMFAYGGWADMSFVAAEVRRPEKNIFRALLLGTGIVAIIYLLANIAFFHALGLAGVVRSPAVAADVLTLWLGAYGARAISILVVISCLGSVNGMLFTGARVFYALGTHHPTFRWLGTWNEHRGVPLRSLDLQVLITLGLVVACRDAKGFERLVIFTAPFYWGFIALVGIALIVLRKRGRTAEATYRVPFFPILPLLFAASSGAMVYAGLDYALQQRAAEGLWAVVVVAAGIIAGCIDWRARHR